MDKLLTDEQREKIVISYLKNILGVSDESINDFVQAKPILHKDICAKMSGIILKGVEPARYDEKSFWEELKPTLDTLYDTAWSRFIQVGAKQGPYMFMISATPQDDRKSTIARLLYMQEAYDKRI